MQVSISVTHFFFPCIPPFEVFDTEQIARGWGLIQERLLGCFLVKIDNFFFFFFLKKQPGDELWDGKGRAACSRSNVQLVTGIQSPTDTH